MSARAKLESQWKAFKHDEPGHRFEHQRVRMKENGRGLRVATTVIGSLLVASGLVMLFIPGPGLLVSFFGLALIAGVSRRLAHLLDRMEPVARRWAHRAKAAWKGASIPAKVALIAMAVGLAGAAAYGMYRWWLA